MTAKRFIGINNFVVAYYLVYLEALWRTQKQNPPRPLPHYLIEPESENFMEPRNQFRQPT
jgi:hypothetical protein